MSSGNLSPLLFAQSSFLNGFVGEHLLCCHAETCWELTMNFCNGVKEFRHRAGLPLAIGDFLGFAVCSCVVSNGNRLRQGIKSPGDAD